MKRIRCEVKVSQRMFPHLCVMSQLIIQWDIIIHSLQPMPWPLFSSVFLESGVVFDILNHYAEMIDIPTIPMCLKNPMNSHDSQNFPLSLSSCTNSIQFHTISFHTNKEWTNQSSNLLRGISILCSTLFTFLHILRSIPQNLQLPA